MTENDAGTGVEKRELIRPCRKCRGFVDSLLMSSSAGGVRCLAAGILRKGREGGSVKLRAKYFATFIIGCYRNQTLFLVVTLSKDAMHYGGLLAFPRRRGADDYSLPPHYYFSLSGCGVNYKH